MFGKATGFLLMSSLLAAIPSGCAQRLAAPNGAESSLVIGRVIIENRDPDNDLPLGQNDKGIKLAVESTDERQFAHLQTTDKGYFVIPNIPARPHFLIPLFSIWDESNGDIDDKISVIHEGYFTTPPGKVVDLGTFRLQVFENARVASNFISPDPEIARAYFSSEFPQSPWLQKPFVRGAIRQVYSHRGKGYRFAGPPLKDWQRSEARFPDIEFRHNAGGGWIGAGGFKLQESVSFAKVNQWWVNSVSEARDWSNIKVIEEKNLKIAGLEAKVIAFEYTDKLGGRQIERTYHIYKPGAEYDLFRIRLNSITERYQWFLPAVVHLAESFTTL